MCPLPTNPDNGFKRTKNYGREFAYRQTEAHVVSLKTRFNSLFFLWPGTGQIAGAASSQRTAAKYFNEHHQA